MSNTKLHNCRKSQSHQSMLKLNFQKPLKGASPSASPCGASYSSGEGLPALPRPALLAFHSSKYQGIRDKQVLNFLPLNHLTKCSNYGSALQIPINFSH